MVITGLACAFVVKSRSMNPVPSNRHSHGTAACGRSAAGSAPAPSPTFSPLYQQIKALITQSLQSGEWKPGELIPSEVELAGRFKVSQGTVRKAIDELAAENLVDAAPGQGHVRRHPPRGARPFPLPAPDARRGRAAPSRQQDHRSQAHARAGRSGAPARPEVRRRGRLHQARDVVSTARRPSSRKCGCRALLFKGLDRRAPGRIQGPDVWLVRVRVRHAHDARRAKRSAPWRPTRRAAQFLQVAEGTPLLCAERVVVSPMATRRWSCGAGCI